MHLNVKKKSKKSNWAPNQWLLYLWSQCFSMIFAQLDRFYALWHPAESWCRQCALSIWAKNLTHSVLQSNRDLKWKNMKHRVWTQNDSEGQDGSGYFRAERLSMWAQFENYLCGSGFRNFSSQIRWVIYKRRITPSSIYVNQWATSSRGKK